MYDSSGTSMIVRTLAVGNQTAVINNFSHDEKCQNL